MPNYAEGKIYAIKSPETEKVYIGSTTQSLNKRFIGHKHDAVKNNSCKSKELFQYKDTYIELIENYSCKTIEELHAKEVEIMKRTPNIINKVMPGIRTVDPLRKEKNTEAKRKARERKKQALLSGVPLPTSKIRRPVKIYTDTNIEINALKQEILKLRSEKDAEINILNHRFIKLHSEKHTEIKLLKQKFIKLHSEKHIEINALKQEILKLRSVKDAEINALKQEILKLRSEKDPGINVLKRNIKKMQNEIIQILTSRNKLMKQVSALILENKILKSKLDKYIEK